MTTWSSKETAPKTGEWILALNISNHPFTVRWFNPVPADEKAANWRDERGKVRRFEKWKAIK